MLKVTLWVPWGIICDQGSKLGSKPSDKTLSYMQRKPFTTYTIPTSLIIYFRGGVLSALRRCSGRPWQCGHLGWWSKCNEVRISCCSGATVPEIPVTLDFPGTSKVTSGAEVSRAPSYEGWGNKEMLGTEPWLGVCLVCANCGTISQTLYELLKIII